jgi:hypothetical protein
MVSLTVSILLFLAESAFSGWIVVGDGAEWLEGSLFSGWVIHPLAPQWPAEAIRVAGALLWIISLGWFVLGLCYPVLRP